MSKTVLSRLLALTRPRAKYRAVLGTLLFLVIAYGATAGIVHSHGRVAPERPGATALDDASGTPTGTGRSQHRECSMCQFQRQLFGGLVHAPLFERTPLAETEFFVAPTVPYHSTSTTAPSGRAPPRTNA